MSNSSQTIIARLARRNAAQALLFGASFVIALILWQIGYMALNLPEALAALGDTRPLRCVSRPPSASPATGSTKKHQTEQESLLAEAFGRG